MTDKVRTEPVKDFARVEKYLDRWIVVLTTENGHISRIKGTWKSERGAEIAASNINFIFRAKVREAIEEARQSGYREGLKKAAEIAKLRSDMALDDMEGADAKDFELAERAHLVCQIVEEQILSLLTDGKDGEGK